MTPAQTLTAAAQKLRDAATAAIHEGRTTWRRGHTLGTKSHVVLDDPERPSVLIETYAAYLERVNAYLELVGPATGLALAAWLDQAAARERAGEIAAARVYTTPDEQAAWLNDHRDHHALAVARQILGDHT